MKKLGNFILLVMICFFATSAYAQEDGEFLFRPGGEGTLSEKLIVTADEAIYYEELGKEGKLIPPLTILWRLDIEDCDNPKNPVQEYKGKTYYRIGDAKGNELGWIEVSQVSSWMTRFVLAPLPPTGDNAFYVFDKAFGQAEYQGLSRADLESAVVAENTRVPKGFASFAFVMNEADGQKVTDENVNLDPESFKKVLIYTGPVTEVSFKDTAAGALAENVELDIVFVVDTTYSMQPMIEIAKKVCKDIAATINADPELKAKVHFGLVDFRDSESPVEENQFGARIDCDLTQSYNEFMAALNNLRAADGPNGDDPEDVLLGLSTAVEKMSWHNLSSKHVILLGDARNKVTAKCGTIEVFRDVYRMANTDFAADAARTALNRKCFHAIFGGDEEADRREFQTVAMNDGEMDGFFSEMTKVNLTEEFRAVIQNALDVVRGKDIADIDSGGTSISIAQKVWDLKKMLGNSTTPSDVMTVEGYAAAIAADDSKVAVMNIMLLYDELESFHAGLATTYKRLNRFDGGGSGNIKKIFDDFICEYVARVAGEDKDLSEYYDRTIVEILGKQLPVMSGTLKMKIRDVMSMAPEQRTEWIKDFKAARDRAKAILDRTDAWYGSGSGSGASARFTFVPLEDMP